LWCISIKIEALLLKGKRKSPRSELDITVSYILTKWIGFVVRNVTILLPQRVDLQPPHFVRLSHRTFEHDLFSKHVTANISGKKVNSDGPMELIQ
jgi:hypothetical protein